LLDEFDFGSGFPEWTELGQEAGLDPLGMQRPIEVIYQSLLPGISTITLRLRVLLQVVLAGAMPIEGIPKAHQILPFSSKEGNDWPRLLGRLLQQHFGKIHALRKLQVEADESEHSRVLDYLATAQFASRAALSGAMSDAGPVALRKPLAVLAKNLQTQIEGAICSDKEDQLHLETLGKKLEVRFAGALGLCGA
jgi:hypothetical protein